MTGPEPRRVAIAHHWFMNWRGGEKVAQAIAALFPDAPLFALAANPDVLSADLRARPLTVSYINKLARISGSHRHWLPFYARAARSLDATAFDLVLCSDAATIKAIRTRPDAIKICYCHSPMRYVWEQTADYAAQTGPVRGLALRLAAPRLRKRDRAAAQTVTAFAANSNHTARRIERCYGRDATVIYPPVDAAFPEPLAEPEDFYLIVGEQVEYKRNDLAVTACAQTRRPLVVVGDGPVLPRLREIVDRSDAPIVCIGRQPDEILADYYRRCRALLFCGQEDFGLVPVEAMATGRPVIAFRKGGATETVLDGETGLFFDRQSPDAVIDALDRFEAHADRFDPARVQQHARTFSRERFQSEFRAFIDRVLEKKGSRVFYDPVAGAKAEGRTPV
jgi:glycosyltransferase involved in cell wall biosynthesis